MFYDNTLLRRKKSKKISFFSDKEISDSARPSPPFRSFPEIKTVFFMPPRSQWVSEWVSEPQFRQSHNTSASSRFRACLICPADKFWKKVFTGTPCSRGQLNFLLSLSSFCSIGLLFNISLYIYIHFHLSQKGIFTWMPFSSTLLIHTIFVSQKSSSKTCLSENITKISNSFYNPVVCC